jgi:hypothetical protein
MSRVPGDGPLGDRLVSDVIQIDNDPFALYELSLKEKWGDGVPLLPPTDERIEAMLAATPKKPSDVVVKELPPRHGTATVELCAINAVMAGCEPRAFPLVLAALEAMDKPEYNGFGLSTTTGPVTPMLIVNGPTRDELGIDCRAGCLGGAAGRGSMTIGRAVALCLRNIGGLRAGDSSRTVYGQPARFGLCFGEWEERSDWPVLATRRGFAEGKEVVTVHGGMGTMPICDVNSESDYDRAYLIGKCIAHPLHNMYVTGMQPPGEVVVLINPVWAERFAKTFPKIESLQECLHEGAWQPIDMWPEAAQAVLRERKRVDSRGRVYAMMGPHKIVPVVCGGLGNLHATLLTSWGESEMQSMAVRRP